MKKQLINAIGYDNTSGVAISILRLLLLSHA
jgi:hypothetical protein